MGIFYSLSYPKDICHHGVQFSLSLLSCVFTGKYCFQLFICETKETELLYVTQTLIDSIHKFGALNAHVKTWEGFDEEWSIHFYADAR